MSIKKSVSDLKFKKIIRTLMLASSEQKSDFFCIILLNLLLWALGLILNSNTTCTVLNIK